MKKLNTREFIPFSKEQLQSFTSARAGEMKLGQTVQTEINDATKCVILGISEDIGPRANLGNGGADTAFEAFLSKFLNMQSNRFLEGASIAIIGTIYASCDSENVAVLREEVAALDDLVVGILAPIDFSDKQLIVIGGGHNNAYPIMKALSEHHEQLSIVNIDPHADCRPLEGRHSGNPFSSAITEEIIDSYSVFGLHQQYNSEVIYQFLEDNNCDFTFFEDYLDGRTLSSDLRKFITEKRTFGLEIDLDAIANMPTSAFTPSGFALDEIRSAIRLLGSATPVYLHLPEGAPKSSSEKTIVGKALAYLVTDFIKVSRK